MYTYDLVLRYTLRYVLPGDIEEFVITTDEKFVVASLKSGEVHCMKLLDKERGDTEDLLSRYPPAPSEVNHY